MTDVMIFGIWCVLNSLTCLGAVIILWITTKRLNRSNDLMLEMYNKHVANYKHSHLTTVKNKDFKEF